MKRGGFFIADEINLAETSVIASLTTALESKEGEEIFVPNNEDPIHIHKDYFFIGCQNDTTMYGRKKLPNSIMRKIVLLEYPFPKGESLRRVILNIANETQNHTITSKILKLVTNIKSNIKHRK